MKKRLAELVSMLMAWNILAVVWMLAVAAFGALAAFRAMVNASISDLFEIRDVPVLDYLNTNYSQAFWFAAGLGGFVVSFFWLACRYWDTGLADRRNGWTSFALGPYRWTLRKTLSLLCPLVFVVCGLFASYCSGENPADTVRPTDWLDWTSIAAVVLTTVLLGRMICDTSDLTESQAVCRESTQYPLLRLAMIYLLSTLTVYVYAVWEHKDFWNSKKNGGYEFEPFFADGEIAQANLVLYTTSLLFASIAAWLGCAGRIIMRCVIPGKPIEGNLSRIITFAESRRLAWLLAGLWVFILGVPWQIKVLEELKAENGWIVPALVFSTLFAGLVPMILVCLLMWIQDFGPAQPDPDDLDANHKFSGKEPLGFFPRRSELAYWGTLLFPVYPILRLLRPAPKWSIAGMLMVLSAGIVTGGIYFVNYFGDWFDFEDWRDMLKSGEIPVLLVFFSLAAASFVYLVGQRFVGGIGAMLGGREVLPAAEPVDAGIEDDTIAAPTESTAPRLPPKHYRIGYHLLSGVRAITVLGVVGILGLATWPFWGWHNVSQNVFARAYEFSNRHEFELGFLHWLFDADRDGYAAVLNGADLDDFDFEIQAGGLGPREVVEVPQDEFQIVESAKASALPSLIVFYLEGVVPRSISAYGHRTLPFPATPHMDSVADDGARFTQARCFYPSTWDAWFAATSGRYLHVTEMDNSQEFGDRYTRYNNLYKVLETAGINRWCHGAYSAYYDLYVPQHLRKVTKTDFKPDYDTSLTDEEEEREVWPGDKYTDRMCEFLDTIEPGERFYMCEHMPDTHFPWRRTKLERAKELGFPEGLTPYEADALVPSGLRFDIYERYYQTITRTDGQIGRVLDKLKERGLYDQTMIVIVSDHGCQWWEHEHMYYVSHLYEQSLHIPLIIKAPGVNPGISCDEPVLHVDIVPTVMELAGIKLANPRVEDPLPGASLVPLMRGDTDPQTLNQFRLRDVPLMTHYDMIGLIHNFQYKLIFDRPAGTYLLYDLIQDPKEMKNLADSHPERLEMMLQRLRDYVQPRKYFTGQIKRSKS